MTKRQVLLECICALLILLFLYASVSKLLDIEHFRRDMMNQPLPRSIKPSLVWIIPITEVIISAALLFEKTRMPGLIASFALMSAFTIYAIMILSHYFKFIPCGCGGVISKLTWPQHLVFNIFFVTITAFAIIQQRWKIHHSIFITKNSLV